MKTLSLSSEATGSVEPSECRLENNKRKIGNNRSNKEERYVSNRSTIQEAKKTHSSIWSRENKDQSERNWKKWIVK